MGKTKAGIINVTGYAGVELARLLFQHPEVELTSVTGRSAAGQKLGSVFPHLAGCDLTIETEPGEVDVVPPVLDPDQGPVQILELPTVAPGYFQHHSTVIFRRPKPVNAGDAGDDHHIPALQNRAGGRMPQLVELILQDRNP